MIFREREDFFFFLFPQRPQLSCLSLSQVRIPSKTDLARHRRRLADIVRHTARLDGEEEEGRLHRPAASFSGTERAPGKQRALPFVRHPPGEKPLPPEYLSTDHSSRLDTGRRGYETCLHRQRDLDANARRHVRHQASRERDSSARAYASRLTEDSAPAHV